MRYFFILLTWTLISMEVKAQFVVDYARRSIGGKIQVTANVSGNTNVSRFNVYEVNHTNNSQSIVLALTANNGYSGTFTPTVWSAQVTADINIDSSFGTSETMIGSDITYYLVPNTMNFAEGQYIASANNGGNTFPASITVIPYVPGAVGLINTTVVMEINLSGSYSETGEFVSGEGTTTDVGGGGGGGDPPLSDAELTALGLELPEGWTPAPGDTIDVQVTNQDGTVTDLTVDAGDISENMTFSLEGVVLGEGDSVSLNNTEWESPIEGTVSTDWKEGYVWTDNNTTLLNSSGLVGGTTGSYTTSTSTSSGSTIVSNTQYDTSTNTVTTTKTKTEAGQGEGDTGDDGRDITNLQELAEVEDAVANAEADGALDAQGVEAASLDLNGMLENLAVERDGLTDLTMSIVDNGDGISHPFPTQSFPSAGYNIAIPTPWGPIAYNINPGEPWMVILRACEYFVLSIMGVRLFFKILVV